MKNSLRRPVWLAGLLGGALFLGCNGSSKIEATIGEFNLGDAKFVFFGKAEGAGLDFSGNDINDTITNLVVVFTDRRSFCRDMDNLSIVEDLSKFGTAQLMIINAELRGIDTDDSPLKGGVVVVDGDNIDVSIGYQSIVDEQNAATAQNPTGDVSMTVNRVNIERMVGELTATLDNGGTAVPISGNFVAHRCFPLDNIALAGGL